MRLLFDARSVRTPAGIRVFQGLTSGWRLDGRVRDVYAAVPSGFDPRLIPAGVLPVPLRSRGWLPHLLWEVPRLIDRLRADLVFVPNGLAPCVRHAVLYFQDLFHFVRSGRGVRGICQQWMRRISQEYTSRHGFLSVCVSTDIWKRAATCLRAATVMIPNGVDTAGRRWAGGGDFVFVLGGFGERKNEDLALHAWADVPSGTRGNTRLVVGGVEPGSRRERLKRLAAEIGAKTGVDVLGALGRDEYLRCIASARLAVSCSRTEAFGLPVAEALAMGAPLLCTDIPAHAELLERARAGATFGAGDRVGLSRGLVAALMGTLPPQTQAFPEGWSWAAIAARHIDAYERYLG